jgi:hypothetical protein
VDKSDLVHLVGADGEHLEVSRRRNAPLKLERFPLIIEMVTYTESSNDGGVHDKSVHFCSRG